MNTLRASFVGAAAFFLSTVLGRGALIAGWDFQGTTDPSGPIGTVIFMPPTTPRVFVANAGAFQSTSSLYLDGTNGSSSFFVGTINGDSELGALNGITANTAGTNFATVTGSPNGGSMALFNRTAQGGIDGKSMVFKLSMDGYEALEFSLAVQRPVSSGGDYGVSLFTFLYSLDGTTFLPWGQIDTGFATSVINQAYTLTPVLNAVNDADTVYIKMTVSGSTNGINSTRIDNIQFNASVVPENGTASGVITAIGLIALRRNRTSRVVHPAR
ncbi:MAG TPA: hypothetical protein VFG14_16560 [Chthoniobacteraceae bacterium]|nr:hypothetical protein [Chthoniobacteraceae bacterium]